MLAFVEDETGAGKTEAMLLLVQRMLLARKGRGLFLALPTMATADAMFARGAAVLGRLFDRPSLTLVHGRARLSERFRDLVEREAASDDVTCAPWLADNRRRALLVDVGIGTIDQTLLSVLPTKFATLRLWGLSGKIDLRGLGDLDAGGAIRSRGNDAGIERVDEVGNLGGGTGGDLHDPGDRAVPVAGIDPLGRISGEEIPVEGQARHALDDGNAVLFGRTGIDGGLVDHHVARRDDAPDQLGGADQRLEVRLAMAVDRRGDGDDVDVAIAQILDLAREAQLPRRTDVLCRHLVRDVPPASEFGHANGIDVKTNGRVALTELYCEW